MLPLFPSGFYYIWYYCLVDCVKLITKYIFKAVYSYNKETTTFIRQHSVFLTISIST